MIISQPAEVKHHVYVFCGAGYELLIFFHWSGSEVIIMQVWDQPCAASLLTKKVYLLSQGAWQTLKMYYLLLPLLQLSHLLLDYKKNTKQNPFYPSSHWSIKAHKFFPPTEWAPHPPSPWGWLSVRQTRHTPAKGSSCCIQILPVPSWVPSASAASAGSQQVAFYPVLSNRSINMGGDVSSQRRRACGGDAVASWLMQRLFSQTWASS